MQPGTIRAAGALDANTNHPKGHYSMRNIIYLVGLVVIVLAIVSFVL
ncbi:hypothetical protein [Roseovarius arcticus]|nr:hypothetical protein [Roseovarius arcticus]